MYTLVFLFFSSTSTSYKGEKFVFTQTNAEGLGRSLVPAQDLGLDLDHPANPSLSLVRDLLEAQGDLFMHVDKLEANLMLLFTVVVIVRRKRKKSRKMEKKRNRNRSLNRNRNPSPSPSQGPSPSRKVAVEGKLTTVV